MLNIFILIVCSSTALGVVYFAYNIAERLFKRHLNLRTKALSLKLIVFIQPIIVLLTVVVLVSGFTFSDDKEVSGKTSVAYEQGVSSNSLLSMNQYLPIRTAYTILFRLPPAKKLFRFSAAICVTVSRAVLVAQAI